jgi:hypothetical protein
MTSTPTDRVGHGIVTLRGVSWDGPLRLVEFKWARVWISCLLDSIELEVMLLLVTSVSRHLQRGFRREMLKRIGATSWEPEVIRGGDSHTGGYSGLHVRDWIVTLPVYTMQVVNGSRRDDNLTGCKWISAHYTARG